MPLLAIDETPAMTPAAVTYDRQLEFLGCSIPSRSTVPGGLLPLRTHWRRIGTIDRYYLMELSLFRGGDEQVMQHTRYLGYGIPTVESMPPGVRFREDYRLIVPRDVRPGSYTLVLRMGARQGPRSIMAGPDDPVLQRAGGYISLGSIEVGGDGRP
jgi:hypothetical protein